jgi:hypothetical protein
MRIISKKNFKLIWIGPMIPQNYLLNWKSTSPAAIKWQMHLLNSLVKKKIDIQLLYYRPERYWPKGRFLPCKEYLKKNFTFKSTQIKYINFLGFRNFSIKYFLYKLLKKIGENKNPLIIISYNSPSWIENIFLDRKIRSRFKCVYLVADTKIPKGGDGYIFLSYYLFNLYRFKKKIHLDGSVYKKKRNNSKNKKNLQKIIFFYSGSFGKPAGLKLLISSINLIKEKNFELWITGHGNDEYIIRESKKDLRIKYLGFLSENQLQKIYKIVDVFINPRLTNMPENNFNFPSKIFDYLAWNKPIISTWTKSLSPQYKNILHLVKDDPQSIANVMQKYIKKKISFRSNKNFVLKSWEDQTSKLISFLNNEVLKK